MKKIYYLAILISSFLGFEYIVVADSIGLNCPSIIILNENFNCIINVNSGTSLAGIAGAYSLSDGLEYVGFSANGGWSNLSNNSNGFALMNVAGQSGSYSIGTITLKASSEGSKTASISFDVSDVDSNDLSIGNAYTTINCTTNKVQQSQSNKTNAAPKSNLNNNSKSNIQEKKEEIEENSPELPNEEDINEQVEDDTLIHNNDSIQIDSCKDIKNKLNKELYKFKKQRNLFLGIVIFMIISMILFLIILILYLRKRKNQLSPNKK